MSLNVIALPSSQVLPTPGAGSNLQPVAVQVSVVHGLLSLQPVTRQFVSAGITTSFENADSMPFASYDFSETYTFESSRPVSEYWAMPFASAGGMKLMLSR